MYPNPTKKGLNLYCNSNQFSDGTLEIRDLVGRIIYTSFIRSSGKAQYIPIENFDPGLYIVTIISKDRVVYKNKIVKED
jgi:hypothetical protein